mmetsp:Transcript_15228/g.37953  ORF Transcript_15228/g.37953 Transcript_15228/m.37953 type:complete len:265 (-) Transcript_15228:1175-1969(-)|eukprot:CAMPEP_0202859124 /NCGR_PEP_ID=MMETSP1391-20130828/1380_1 /ASSEMBLY_ACC=CAM_ASM_000867 /TAXON_ID=1034604 /ORGANISM="Chlamydomonas leiostraca, Strain SAG 11-49" /LENGTH=264 /DNA_ID=CAMNT_0049538133 /DNA_START=84 /DNA_END=878 /DNA_ORIENTATION=-
MPVLVLPSVGALGSLGALAKMDMGSSICNTLSGAQQTQRRNSSSQLPDLSRSRRSSGSSASTSGPGPIVAMAGGLPTKPRRGSCTTAGATRQFEAVAIRSRSKRRGRRGGSSGGSDDGGSGSGDENWDDGMGGSGFGNWGFGGSGGSGGGWYGSGGGWIWGRGGPGGSGGYNEGAFHLSWALYECMWFWQLLCAASLVHSLHFMLVGERKHEDVAAPVATASAAAAAPTSVVMAAAAATAAHVMHTTASAAAGASAAGVGVEAH